MPEHKARSVTAEPAGAHAVAASQFPPFVLPIHFTHPGEEQGVQIVAGMEVQISGHWSGLN